MLRLRDFMNQVGRCFVWHQLTELGTEGLTNHGHHAVVLCLRLIEIHGMLIENLISILFTTFALRWRISVDYGCGKATVV